MNRNAVNALKRETPNDQIKKVDEPPGDINDDLIESMMRRVLKRIIDEKKQVTG